jgi:PAS domain S-box-containing protein
VARRVDEEPSGGTGAPEGELAPVDELPILLVDDRPENLRALEAVLEPLGRPLESATSGAEALRMLLTRDYALILLDVRMPGLPGLETARVIKQRERTRDVPIVFLTAARDEVEDMIRGYGVGAVDYVLKPFDPELLRSKVGVFAELDASRRALKQSEQLLRAAFEAAPIGKTLLDSEHRIVRSNPAFARLLGRGAPALKHVLITHLSHPDDRELLAGALDELAMGAELPDGGIDLRLRTVLDSEVSVAMFGTSIETAELDQPLLLVQWVDLTARRRAEQARAELLLEQAARAHAEAVAERLDKLQSLSTATESASLDQLLPGLAIRLAELFGAELAEVRVDEPGQEPHVVRAAAGRLLSSAERPSEADASLEAPLRIDRTKLGAIQLVLPAAHKLTDADRSLLHDAADRAALSIRRAQLHEAEHRIAVELQRGLLPKRLPEVPGVEITAHYEAAGVAAEVGGDWYDAFTLPHGRIGVVVGDVTGRGVPAASSMGQARSVTRAFALGEDGHRSPGEVLTRLNSHQLSLGTEEMLTVVYAIVDPAANTVTWANAGHLPPLLRSATGERTFLNGGDALIGVANVDYESRHHAIGDGSLLMLYTDGLIERRGEPLDTGFARLRDALREGPDELEDLCDELLTRLLGEPRELHDDVTAVLLRMTGG